MAYQASGPGPVALQFLPHQQTSNSAPLRDPFRFSKHPISAERVLKSFNTRAFKREQPDTPELMLKVISEALVRHEPIPFVSYWGKGLRPVLAAPEHACLDYLATMTSRVADVYKTGAKFSLVFTDTHATLNGHSAESIASYYEDLTLAARKRGFAVSLLSKLMDTHSFGVDTQSATLVPSDDLMVSLSHSAAKWFRGEGSATEGAIRYYQANMVERLILERAHPRSIFVTFNGSKLRSLFPDTLPVFYMYSLRHGISDKPWFLPPDAFAKPAAPAMQVEAIPTA